MIAVKMITAVLIVVITVGVILCQTFEKQQSEIKKKFKCKDPQPRTVYPHEIIGDEEWKNKSYKDKIKDITPVEVVLHRCENSGCCKTYDERCKSWNVSYVDVTFNLKVTHPGGLTFHFEHIKATATNHTSCKCQQISADQIK